MQQRSKVCLLLAGFLWMTTMAMAQVAERIDLSLQKITLKEFFLIIENRTDYTFVYNNVDLRQTINIDVRNKKLDEILGMVFEPLGISYKLSDLHIILKREPITRQTRGSQPTIWGIVTNGEGQPVAGATIMVKGSNKSTISAVDGTFSLVANSAGATLIVTSIGFEQLEWPVNGQTDLEITLKTNLEVLDEVVVVGYGSIKKSDLTGAISSVKGTDLARFPVRNTADALMGKVAGLDVTQGGNSPGDGVNVLIRGRRSLTAGNAPLFVVDGLPMDDINTLNPNDVESVEVLKDASSTAIYGSRGANGVILVTTKRGLDNRTTITYDGYVGPSQPTRLLEMMDGQKYAEMVRTVYRSRHDDLKYATDYPDPFQDRKIISDPYSQQSILMAYEWEDEARTIVKRDAAGIPIYHPGRVRSTNWSDLYLRDGLEQRHNLAINGGGQKTKMMFGFTYFNDKGIVLNQDYELGTVRFNVEHQANEWFMIGAQTHVSLSVRNSGTNLYGQSPLQLSPLTSPYDENGSMVQYPGGSTLLYNPLFGLDDIVANQKKYRAYGTLFARAKLAEGLQYESRFGYDIGATRAGTFNGSQTFERRGALPTASNNYSMGMRYIWDNLLTYNRTLGDGGHTINAVIGQSAEQFQDEGLGMSIEGMPYEHAQFYNMGIGESVTGQHGGYSRWNLLSFLGRANYSFKNKYLFTLSGRYDGSSRLAEGNKWAFFPSAAVAWRLAQEDFLQDIDAINELKLRLSYGQNGNSAINPYQTLGALSRTVYNWNNETPAFGFMPSGLGVKDLGWERTSSVNLGLDFSLIDSRISGSVEVYQQTTDELLMERPLPEVSGFGSVIDNVGKTRNRGLEVTLNSVNVRSSKGFNWQSTATFSTYSEQILKLNDGLTQNIDRGWFVGQALYSFYTYELQGIWGGSEEELAEIAKYSANGVNYAPGKYKVKDQNGDYKINTDDHVIIGNDKPSWYGSLENSFSYRNFDLSFLLYMRIGQMVSHDLYARQLISPANLNNVVNLDYWHVDNQNAKFPAPRFDQAIVDFGNFTASVRNGSYLRVRNINLGYTIQPNRLVNAAIRVYASAQNPLLFTSYDFIDPESARGTGTPSVRKYVFGINITL